MAEQICNRESRAVRGVHEVCEEMDALDCSSTFICLDWPNVVDRLRRDQLQILLECIKYNTMGAANDWLSINASLLIVEIRLLRSQ